jgi:alpha-mannosidase
MLPEKVDFGTIPFSLAPPSGLNAITPRGQTLELPAGEWQTVYLLAAADGDQTEVFHVGDSPVELTVQDWTGYIGQWDNRIWTTRQVEVPPREGSPANTRPRLRTVTEATGLIPGYVKRAPVAWFASHRHGTDGTNEPYQYSYLFAHAIDLPAGETTLTLPFNDRIRILAVTVAEEGSRVVPAHPLYDTMDRAGYNPPDFTVGR